MVLLEERTTTLPLWKPGSPSKHSENTANSLPYREDSSVPQSLACTAPSAGALTNVVQTLAQVGWRRRCRCKTQCPCSPERLFLHNRRNRQARCLHSRICPLQCILQASSKCKTCCIWTECASTLIHAAQLVFNVSVLQAASTISALVEDVSSRNHTHLRRCFSESTSANATFIKNHCHTQSQSPSHCVVE